jgi:predicted neuraminidase
MRRNCSSSVSSGRKPKPDLTKHPARIEALKNGDLYITYYGGEGEYAIDTGVYGSRLRKGGRKWSEPVRIAHDPFYSLGNAVIWQAPDGLVWLFYVVRPGDYMVHFTCAGPKSHAITPRTWSDAFPLINDQGMMVCNKPIVLHNGHYLLPLYFESGFNTEFTSPESSGLFLHYDPKKKDWQQSSKIRSATGNIHQCQLR